MKKTSLAAAITILLCPVAVAESNWEIQDLTGEQLGNNSETAFVVNLSTTEANGNDPLTPEVLGNDVRIQYYYNASVDASEALPLQNLYSSYWFSTEKVSRKTGNYTRYEAAGTATNNVENSVEEANTTTQYSIGNLTPVITTNTSKRFKPGQPAMFEALVKNSTGDNQTSDVELNIKLTDFKTGQVEDAQMTQIDDGDLFVESDIPMFDRFNSSFYLEVSAEDTSSGLSGEASAIVRTPPKLSGRLDSLGAERCSSDTFPSVCQPGSRLEPSLSVENGEVNKVNATLLAGENDDLVGFQELSQTDGGSYNGTLTVPTLNTSNKPENMSLVLNASTQRQSLLKRHSFNYSAFELEDKGNERTAAGDYGLRLIVTRPFSPDPIPPENLSGEAAVFDIDGTVLEEFSLDDLAYRQQPGVYTESVAVDDEGTYDVVFNVSDQYDANDTLRFSFGASSDLESFSAPETVGVIRNKTGDVPFSFNITSNLEQPLGLNFSSSGELEQNISVNSGENLTVESSEETVVPYNLSGQTLYEKEGDINVEGNVTGYSEDVEIEVIEPFCGVIRDGLCHSSSEVESQIVEGNFTEIDLKYIGEYNSTETYQLGLTGNVSNMASVSNESLQMEGNYRQDSATLNLTYDPETPGFYSGNLTSDTGNGPVVQSELELSADVDDPSFTADVPVSIDIGTLPAGEDVEREVETENTGQVPIESATASSEEFSVEASTDGIDVGEGGNITLSFSQLRTSSGAVTLTIENGDVSTEYEISVSSELIPDYTEEVPDLIDIAREKETSSPTTNPELGQAQTELKNAESAYQEGDYERARELFTDAEDTINSFEAAEQQSETDTGSPTGETDTGSQSGNNEGGSGGLLIAALVILILLAVGFVTATSIELEPGDPLYGVFGGQ